ncbi:uncharacterized protein TRIADDRAFT_28849 [Trichoplax adhaerens]|uniref:Chromodomain-helicase-DNA-binding protein 1-like n=1 Tax=Trichoplax adhaerens TaxID=10228 RepID=B3S4A8_TRIAD|nr:hypothetical protein TRIADDRAFT_28849 [Trichoplax adhaerens]EDV22607.1 hypothetical protein TRIADDRAFT_28849 [Trichoplax adhaerens]|eukprot:XP_002115151.1 hypothetical protein TRIADDRAFT_28849 [Trichoplax adhaerens]
MSSSDRPKLREHQVEGVKWINKRFLDGHGCILGDEMGLGKTAQVVMLNVCNPNNADRKCQFLILSPLSVLNNWQVELTRFGPSLTGIVYAGSKEDREQLRTNIGQLPYHVLMTTYEICMKDAVFLEEFKWKVLIVDEAQRLKNSNSMLYQILKQFRIQFSLLLTGTPVQNNLNELYSLLSFIEPKKFRLEDAEYFIDKYATITEMTGSSLNDKLRSIIKPYILRRVKKGVLLDLPLKSEMTVDCGLSHLQRKLYKALLQRNIESLTNEASKTSLMNMLIQLRKCVNHPYLFNGIEPEPFEIGDHLINASGKLFLLDKLLPYLKSRGHKVLIFSQMTRMLDILQDYLSYKDYNYERLDGSVRGEERYLAIQNFTDPDVFVFILSTKAGGVGLNLVAADTVIFFDSDFNPQNDIQAAARCHRIGQTKPVKIIRFVAQSTVEEIILKRAEAKLKLTDAVIEGGHVSYSLAILNSLSTISVFQLLSIIKFGLSKILESEDSTIEDQDIESLIGSSVDSKWVVKDSDNETKVEFIAETQNEKPPESMYHYEGHDYSKEPSQADISAFDSVLVKADELHRTLRSNKGVTVSELPTATRKRKPLTEEQLEERRRKRIESAAKKAKLQEEQRIKREKKMREKLEETWRSKGYTSLNLPLDSEGESDTDEEENMEEDCLSADTQDIKYVSGDVAMPKTQDGDSIVVHCVDDSGRWGKGGVFSALSTRSAQPEQLYLLAGKMKDLTLGDAHLIAIDDRFSRDNGNDYVAVIVAQKRDRQNQLSPIHLTALSTGFERVATYAKRTNATVHLPRIGYATPKFNWYGTERLIRKHLTARGIPTFMYPIFLTLLCHMSFKFYS